MSLPAGVPQLLNVASWPTQILVQSRAIYDLYLNIFGKKTNRYDILLNGDVYLEVGISSVSIQQSSRITNIRLEKGTFSSINKVIEPRVIEVEIIKSYKPKGLQIFSDPIGGITDFFDQTNNDPEITALINKIEGMKSDFNLYEIKTPDYTYGNMNMVDFKRMIKSDENYKLLVMQLTFQEVIDVNETLTDVIPAKKKEGEATVDKGQVQPTPSTLDTQISTAI